MTCGIRCLAFILLAASTTSVCFASGDGGDGKDIFFKEGTVLCSNYRPADRSCRAITTITAVEDNQRFARNRRMVAMPEENLLLETEEVARIEEEGIRICPTGDTLAPVISPDHYSYVPVLLSVYEDKRDKKLARGVCHEYRRCGTGWHVYVTYDDTEDAFLVSHTTVFGPDDSGRLGLSLRYREFGISERIGTECQAG